MTNLCNRNKCDTISLEIDKNFDFISGMPVKSYYCCGNGIERGVCCGSLFSTEKTNISPQKRVKLALEAASNYCTCVAGPYIIKSIKKIGDL